MASDKHKEIRVLLTVRILSEDYQRSPQFHQANAGMENKRWVLVDAYPVNLLKHTLVSNITISVREVSANKKDIAALIM